MIIKRFENFENIFGDQLEDSTLIEYSNEQIGNHEPFTEIELEKLTEFCNKMGFEILSNSLEFRFHVPIPDYGKRIKDIASRSFSKKPGLAMFSIFKSGSGWFYIQFFMSDFGKGVSGGQMTGKKSVLVYNCDDIKTFFSFVNDMLK
jgi:hypothetical protein